MSEYARKIGRIDRLALGLSALCGAHCLATSLLIGVMASLGGILDSPLVHEVGLALAIILGALALGAGTFRHRNLLPFVIGSVGLADIEPCASAQPAGRDPRLIGFSPFPKWPCAFRQRPAAPR
jgi:hypothetical protein